MYHSVVTVEAPNKFVHVQKASNGEVISTITYETSDGLQLNIVNKFFFFYLKKFSIVFICRLMKLEVTKQ